jgi:hypothetical protein
MGVEELNPDSGSLLPQTSERVPLVNVEDLQALNIEVVDPRGRNETLSPLPRLTVLNREIGESELGLQRFESLAKQDRMSLEAVRTSLGLEQSEDHAKLASEQALEARKEAQEALVVERERLIQEEVRIMLEESVALIFTILRKVEAQVVETVLLTGNIPAEYHQGRILQVDEEMEKNFVRIVAQAYKKGYATLPIIEEHFPNLAELEHGMEPALTAEATKRIESKEAPRLEDVGQTQLENRNEQEVLNYHEPKQIAESSENTENPTGTQK